VAIKILASGLYGQEAYTIPQHEGWGEARVCVPDASTTRWADGLRNLW